MSITETSTTISLLKNLRLTDPTGCTPAGPPDISKSYTQTCFPASISGLGEWHHHPPHHPTWNLRSHLWLLLLYSYIQQVAEPVNSFSQSFFYPLLLSFLLLNVILTSGIHNFLPVLANSLPLVSSSHPLKLSSPATPNLSSNTPVIPELLVFLLHVFSSIHLHVVFYVFFISIIFMSLCLEHSTFSLLIY